MLDREWHVWSKKMGMWSPRKNGTYTVWGAEDTTPDGGLKWIQSFRHKMLRINVDDALKGMAPISAWKLRQWRLSRINV